MTTSLLTYYVTNHIHAYLWLEGRRFLGTLAGWDRLYCNELITGTNLAAEEKCLASWWATLSWLASSLLALTQTSY